MISYILRRLVTAVLILLGASFIVYLMTAASGDPLWDLYGNPNAQQLIPALSLIHISINGDASHGSG